MGLDVTAVEFASGWLVTPLSVDQSAARPARVNWQTLPQSFRQWLALNR
jgi:hypothetical protein